MRVLLAVALLASCADGKKTMSTTTPPPVAARSAGLELAVSARGTVLHVVLRNQAEGPLTIVAAVAGPERKHHDYLRAELTGAATRTLRFTGNRNTSETGVVTLEPGGETADDVDLAAWATAPINDGAPLAPGEYQVTVIYRLEQPGITGSWRGEVAAGPIAVRAP